MKIVDSFSGRVVGTGDWLTAPGGHRIMLAAVIDRGIFDVEVLLREMHSAQPVRVRCVVRFLHPGFLFQRVAFIPS